MIVGKLSEWEEERYAYSSWLSGWLSRLREIDFTDRNDGEYAFPDGARLIVKTADTSPLGETLAERHERHADIHLVIDGEEWFGFARNSASNVRAADAAPVDDHVFFKEVKNEQFVCLQPGDFAVWLPNDVHRPCCSGGSRRGRVRKAVVKIPIR